jgi:hypothetical protein
LTTDGKVGAHGTTTGAHAVHGGSVDISGHGGYVCHWVGARWRCSASHSELLLVLSLLDGKLPTLSSHLLLKLRLLHSHLLLLQLPLLAGVSTAAT